jgi:aminomethyltransferase
MVDFLGWQLPGVYTSPEEECKMVRERAGFTDYSLSNQLAVVGKGAFNFLQKIIVNDLRKISKGRMIYSSIFDDTGKFVEDGTVLWVDDNYFIMNYFDYGIGTAKEGFMQWLKENAKDEDADIVDTGLCWLAFQGPKSREILQKVTNVADLPFFGMKQAKISGIPVLITRAGFTGEIGYELYTHWSYAHPLWDLLIELGKEYNVGPYGLAVMEIQGMEKGYLWSDDYVGTPLEWGLGWTVGFDKGDFISKDALMKRKSEGLKTKLVGFEVSDPSVVAVTGDKIFKGDNTVGKVTNAAYGLTLGKSLGRAMVNIDHTGAGEELDLEHDGKRTKLTVAKSYRWYDPEDKIVKG